MLLLLFLTLMLPLQPVSQLAPRTVTWLWPGRLALGRLAILDGDPGLGKSLLALDLCARLSIGRPFPDESTGPGVGNALVLNREDGEGDTIRPRLQALGADLERVFVMPLEVNALSQPLRFPTHTGRLAEAVKQTEARLVVMDPLMVFLEPGVQTSNDSSVRRALLRLGQFAEQLGIMAGAGCHALVLQSMLSSTKAWAPHPSRTGANRDRDTTGEAAYLVHDGERLIARSYQRDSAGEGMHAVIAAVAGGKRVVARQHGAGVGVRGGERHGALVVKPETGTA